MRLTEVTWLAQDHSVGAGRVSKKQSLDSNPDFWAQFNVEHCLVLCTHRTSLIDLLRYSFLGDKSHEPLVIPVKINVKSSTSPEWKKKTQARSWQPNCTSTSYLYQYNYTNGLIYQLNKIYITTRCFSFHRSENFHKTKMKESRLALGLLTLYFAKKERYHFLNSPSSWTNFVSRKTIVSLFSHYANLVKTLSRAPSQPLGNTLQINVRSALTCVKCSPDPTSEFSHGCGISTAPASPRLCKLARAGMNP